ncbi:ADP-ribosylation factor-like protein 15 isoform 7-T7 [Hipposideros larvatus]|uniref:ADP-ribosylation factor-like protein 15 n=1 Tax=Hipposideros armiger TaxID=186990 RepID=A0A8B7R7F5_HIPAR|nr:PREDICTED: ADP-ribosylation factor-like protein 15 isoform X5 [Hipposideros armiger]
MTDLQITEAFLYMDYLVAEKYIQLKIINHLDYMLHLSCVSGCKSSMTTCFRALCCKGPPPARPEYDLVCIGLTGAGKTSLLSKLCSESPDNVVSTTGFSIKAVPFQNAILNVKELGGADNIRKYWSRYYQGSQGVIFVLDSASSEDDLETARNELHSALQHPQLCTLPFLILANHQDKPAARSVQEVKKYFELEPLARGKRWILQPCSLDDMDALKDSFSQLINLLEEKDHEAVRM